MIFFFFSWNDPNRSNERCPFDNFSEPYAGHIAQRRDVMQVQFVLRYLLVFTRKNVQGIVQNCTEMCEICSRLQPPDTRVPSPDVRAHFCPRIHFVRDTFFGTINDDACYYYFLLLLLRSLRRFVTPSSTS